MSERALYRVGGWTIIVGAVTAFVLNILHPRVDDYANYSEAVLREVAASGSWIPLHLGLLVAGVLLTVGLVVAGRSIGGERGRVAGRVAMAVAVIGGSVATVVLGYDGIAMKRVADLAGGAGADVRSAALVASEIGWALFMTLNIVSFGLVPAVFGVALWVGEGFARWLAAAGVVLGVAAFALGSVGAAGPPTSGWILAYTVISALTIAWLLALGTALLRRAPGPDRSPAADRRVSAAA